MKYEIKKSQEKEQSIYKTLYIKKSIVKQIDEIANQNKTSWNNVVISMIEACLKDED